LFTFLPWKGSAFRDALVRIEGKGQKVV